MAAVWEHRFADLVKALLARRESTALELVPDMLPVLDLLSPLPELAWLRGERWVGASALQGASAGNFSAVVLRNPAGSNHLFRVEAIMFAPLAAATVVMGVDGLGADLANIVPKANLDTRSIGTGVGSYSNDALAAALTGGRFFQCVATPTGFDQKVEPYVTLQPGSRLYVQCLTVNTGMEVSMNWCERPVSSPDELRRR